MTIDEKAELQARETANTERWEATEPANWTAAQIHAHDQNKAATETAITRLELTTALAEAVEGRNIKRQYLDRTDGRVIARLNATLELWGREFCPHAVPPQPGTVYQYTPRLGLFACAGCFTDLLMMHLLTGDQGIVAEGDCDLCREPSDLFQTTASSVGPVILFADVCIECRGMLTGGAHDDQATPD